MEQQKNFVIIKQLLSNDFKSEDVRRVNNVELTPTDVDQILLRNTNNIPPSKHKIEQYAEDMKKGEWKYNGDCIRFNKNGVLLDGQNRLMAARSIDFYLVVDIVLGLDDEVFDTIDRGRVRNHGHMLFRELKQEIKPSTSQMLSRAIKKILLHDSGYSQCAAVHKIKGEKIDTKDKARIEYVKKNPIIIEQMNYVINNFDSYSVAPRATILYVYHIGSRYDVQYARAFIDKAFGGENLIREEPCWHLYNLLRRIKNKSVNWSQSEIEHTIIKVWNLVATKGVYKLKRAGQIKAKLDDKIYVMKRPKNEIRDSVKCRVNNAHVDLSNL